MGVVFGVIWAADCNNAIRFHVRQPARRLRVTRRLLAHQNSRVMIDISLWVGIDLGVIWAAALDNAIRF